MADLPVPALLLELLDTGRWPRNTAESNRQNLSPLVALERIRALAPEEWGLHLYPPPFSSVGRLVARGDFHFDTLVQPAGIDADLALLIGGFGIGSDTVIALDYRPGLQHPEVWRTVWDDRVRNGSPPSHWAKVTDTFEEFVQRLGL